MSTKKGSYRLRDYEKDVRLANEIYDRVIISGCTNLDGCIEPRTDEELMLIKSRARAARNQHLGVAGKRLRADAAMRLLDALEGAGWDMTATLAVHATKTLLGRAIERKKLIARYGRSGRTAADKSADFEKLKTLNENPIFLNSQKHLSELLDEALKIRKRIAPPREGKAFIVLQKSAELNKQR